MSGGSANGEFISAAIAGQREGERFLRRLDSCSPPDGLFAAIVAAFDANDPSQARLRGLCRALQKHAERVAA